MLSKCYHHHPWISLRRTDSLPICFVLPHQLLCWSFTAEILEEREMSKILTLNLTFGLHFLLLVTHRYPFLSSFFIHPVKPNYTSWRDTRDETDHSISPGLKSRWKSHFSPTSARNRKIEVNQRIPEMQQRNKAVSSEDMSHSSLEAQIYIPLSS